MTNAEIVKEFMRLVAATKYLEAIEHYHDDVVVISEFGLPAASERSGKEGIRAMLKARLEAPDYQTPRMYRNISIKDLVIHQTTDPDVVIAEWTYVSDIEGYSVENRNIIVVTFKDGKIIRSRDYHNHVSRAVAAGEVDAILATIKDMILPIDR